MDAQLVGASPGGGLPFLVLPDFAEFALQNGRLQCGCWLDWGGFIAYVHLSFVALVSLVLQVFSPSRHMNNYLPSGDKLTDILTPTPLKKTKKNLTHTNKPTILFL